ncbi:hypothetical protein DER44DRAFT_864616 [Fusarium oxysporum]|nr:hypothetical protein DER44DRAFT_864616 [Fusarium oxysporum]
MMQRVNLLALWLLASPCVGINITPSNDANVLANAVFSGTGVVITSASYQGATDASGTFTNGPFGIGSGGIFTSGSASGAAPGGNTQVANGAAGSATYCGSNTFDGSLLTVDLVISPGYNGLLIQLILASSEDFENPDPIGVYLDGTQYANDPNGDRLTATSSYLNAIQPPNSDTSYDDSSPPLLFGIQTTAGAHQVVIAICDDGDRSFDSGLMINAQACTDCNQPIIVNYVTTTTTVAANVATSTTSTIPASGTVSGTFIVTVQEAETTTTTAEPTTTTTEADTTTTTEADTTTTTEADTTTTTEADTTTTEADTTTTTEADTTTTTEAGTTTTTEVDTTTTTEAGTTTTTEVDTTTTTEADTTTTTEAMTTTTTETRLTTTETTETTETDSKTDAALTTTTTEAASTTTATETESTTSAKVSEPATTITGTSSETENVTSTTLAASDTATATDETSTSEIVSTSSATASNNETPTESATSGAPASTVGSTVSEDVSETATSSTVGGQPTAQQTTTEMETSVEQPGLSSSAETTVTISTQTQDTTSTRSPDITSSSPITSSQEVAPASTASSTPKNLETIGAYSFVGCLGSLEDYPTFTEVLTDPLMTTRQCIALAAGRKYIGIYQRSCYAADSLTGAGLVVSDSCDLLCPGDPSLFCGGNVRRNVLRRSIPSDRLLTLYAAEDLISISSDLPISTTKVASLSGTTIQEASSSVDEINSSQALTSIPLESSLVAPGIETTVPYRPSESTEGIPETTQDRLPIPFPTAGSIRTMRYSQGFNYTRTATANTVTTMVYTTVHPNNPTLLITTQVAVTLGYEPCNCDHQVYPTVDMTTIIAPCSACGPNNEDSVTLAVPTAACKSAQLHEQPDSSDEIQEHYVSLGVEVYTYSNSKPQPTQEEPASPSPLNNQGAVEPTKAYSYQPGSTKTWTSEALPTGHTTYPTISKTPNPASAQYGTNTPMVVAEAVNIYRASWNVVAIVCIVAVLLF